MSQFTNKITTRNSTKNSSRLSCNSSYTTNSSSTFKPNSSKKVCLAQNNNMNSIPEVIRCHQGEGSSSLNHIQCCDCLEFFDLKCSRLSTLEFGSLMKENDVVWFGRKCHLTDITDYRKEPFNIVNTGFTELLKPVNDMLVEYNH